MYLATFVLSPRYTSTTTFIPESSTALEGGFASFDLMNQAGLTGRSGTQTPQFYARLLQSRLVRSEVLADTLSGGRTVQDALGFGDGPAQTRKALERLSRRCRVSVDRMPGIIRLDVEMSRPEDAQAVAESCLKTVDRFNSNLQRSVASSRTAFLGEQFEQARHELDRADSGLRDFLRSNRQFDSPELIFEKQRLERRVMIAEQLYMALSRQAQTASVEAANDTPVISVIDTPNLPTRASYPRRAFLAAVAFTVFNMILVLVIISKYRKELFTGWEPSAPKHA
jgi:capsule polysaccharide export protein KpsE/RkpR